MATKIELPWALPQYPGAKARWKQNLEEIRWVLALVWQQPAIVAAKSFDLNFAVAVV